jgi:hypothetical protein
MVVHANRLKLYEGPELVRWEYVVPEDRVDIGLVREEVVEADVEKGPEEDVGAAEPGVESVEDTVEEGDDGMEGKEVEDDAVKEVGTDGEDDAVKEVVEEKESDVEKGEGGEVESPEVVNDEKGDEGRDAKGNSKVKSKLNPNAPAWCAVDKEKSKVELADEVGSGEEDEGVEVSEGGRSRRLNRRKPARYLEEC